jgi:hypothetical protein
MPQDQRISQKMKDLITLILVPNPLARPNIDQVLLILENWNQMQEIKLTQDAYEIKQRLA